MRTLAQTRAIAIRLGRVGQRVRKWVARGVDPRVSQRLHRAEMEAWERTKGSRYGAVHAGQSAERQAHLSELRGKEYFYAVKRLKTLTGLKTQLRANRTRTAAITGASTVGAATTGAAVFGPEMVRQHQARAAQRQKQAPRYYYR